MHQALIVKIFQIFLGVFRFVPVSRPVVGRHDGSIQFVSPAVLGSTPG